MNDPYELDLNTSEEELVRACQKIEQYSSNNEGKDRALNYLTSLLNLKQQSKLLNEQNEFNLKLLGQNGGLVKATWALAVITALLAIGTIAFNFLF